MLTMGWEEERKLLIWSSSKHSMKNWRGGINRKSTCWENWSIQGISEIKGKPWEHHRTSECIKSVWMHILFIENSSVNIYLEEGLCYSLHMICLPLKDYIYERFHLLMSQNTSSDIHTPNVCNIPHYRRAVQKSLNKVITLPFSIQWSQKT